jgi:hypothetical protein
VPSNSGRLDTLIYVVTMEASQPLRARYTHVCSYLGNPKNVCVCACVCVCVCVRERERERDTFVVVPVVTVETQIICMYV